VSQVLATLLLNYDVSGQPMHAAMLSTVLLLSEWNYLACTERIESVGAAEGDSSVGAIDRVHRRRLRQLLHGLGVRRVCLLTMDQLIAAM